MDFKLDNGFVMKLTDKKKEVPKETYLHINATGYHGDMDYNVNEEATIYFNNDRGFKDFITFMCFDNCCEFDELKEEYQKIFVNVDEFEELKEEWREFSRDYSEMHDDTIDLSIRYSYVIEGKTYSDDEVDFDIFKED